MDLVLTFLTALVAPFLGFLLPGEKVYWAHVLGSVLLAVLVLLRAGERTPARAVFSRDVWSHASARVDVRFYFLNGVVLALLFLPFLASKAGAAKWVVASMQHELGPAPFTLPPGVATSVLLAIVAALANDFAVYAPHWLQHRVPLLWQFHKVHHSAEVLTPLTAYRFHPVDEALNVAFIVGIVGLTDGLLLWVAPSETTALTLSGVNAVTFLFYFLGVHLRHSHVWLAYPRAISHVLISPAMHQLHHSIRPEHHGKNFGLVFSVWDRLFGTLYIPEERLQLRFGLGGGEEQEFSTVRRLYWLPFKKAAALLGRAPAAPPHLDPS